MYSIKANKIQAIKDIRKFCEDTFGYTSGLRETKDFVESFINQSDAAVTAWQALAAIDTAVLRREIERRERLT